MARQVLPRADGRSRCCPTCRTGPGTNTACASASGASSSSSTRLGITPTLSINARVCEDYPRVAEAARDAGWEFMGHACDQGPIHKVEDQAGDDRALAGHAGRFTGRRPVGWLGPGLTQTFETPDLLAAAGVRYIGDWVYDDEPTEIRTAHGPLVTLPYTVELQRHPDDDRAAPRGRLLDAEVLRHFDRWYQEGAERPKIMAIAIHPYISGQPFRIGYLEEVYEHINRLSGVLHWNGEQILDWYTQSKAARG